MKFCPEQLPFNMLRALATAQVAAAAGGTEKWLLMSYMDARLGGFRCGLSCHFKIANSMRKGYHSIGLYQAGKPINAALRRARQSPSLTISNTFSLLQCARAHEAFHKYAEDARALCRN